MNKKFVIEYVSEMIYTDNQIDIGKAAILISVNNNKLKEKFIIEYYNEIGIKSVITEVAGSGDVLMKKIINSCVGAALNMEVIDKKPNEIHALIHAAQEACHGLMLDMPLLANLHMKISIVRKGNWICVAIYGNSAYHLLSNHSRMGMGYMNI